ncbi:uncharacterized protein Z520_01887 [Fonsecaea multimorphosa CBS 102226]|uniref:Uncharacterized protein n=1 Tax=Fonsecaea multimorphosa CBS 102226 TaxID=1442371 RepID=A0A0D2KY39_9EURO|nr:uncharacterized protein Z520_01887 [Fonsecaea multimorphosa CBS 102226]KIY01749.1 hypothetical protein Z520_01887 [Fonsecaea multimorphosa CBS 102226]OAL29943.1 hypothetical protein AYO22_01849 [Fonsecaea multimorphosa]
MQLTKCVMLDHILLVLYSFIAVSTAQSVSTLPNGCYITSSIVYGNTTGSNTVTTTSQDQTIISTSSSASTSSFSNGASSFSSTIAPSNTFSTTSPTLPTTTASSPTSSPFVITVSGIGNKLRARAVEFLTFEGIYAYLSPNEDLAAVFVLTMDGQLQVGNATVGTNGNRSALPLMQFSGVTQPSGYIWSFNATNLIFGNTIFSVIPDGLLFADFPGSQPPEGAVQVGMAAEFVDVSTSSSSLATLTSTSSTSIESISILVTTPSTAEQQTSESTQSTPGSSLTTNQVSSSVASTESGPPSDTTTTTIEATSGSLQSTEITYTSTSASSLTTQETSTTLASQSSAQISSSILSILPESTTSSSLQLSLSVETSSTTVSNDFTSSPSSQTTNAQPSPTTSSSSTTIVATTEGASPSSPMSTHSSLATTASPSATLSFSISASASQSPSLSSSVTTPTTTLATPTSQSTTNSPSGQGTSRSASTSSSSTTITTTTSKPSPTSSYTVSTTISTSVSPTPSSSLTLSSTSSSTPIPSPYPAKRGLVYTNVTTLDFYPPPSPYISWSYNYYSLPNASDNVGPYPSSQYRFIPLLYNDADSLTSIWPANVNFSIANYGTDAIFGFNEPDANFNGQSSNMPVAESVQGYVNFMQPFAGRVKIGAPAVTNTGGGLTYLAQFLGNATQLNLTIDFLNIHWYASPYNIDYFESYLLQTYNLSLQYFPDAPVPVWVTEFGMDMDNYDQNTTVQFLKNASSFMDDTFWVERYAWFGNFAGGYTSYGAPTTDMLLNVDGSALGVLGEVWYTYNGTN